MKVNLMLIIVLFLSVSCNSDCKKCDNVSDSDQPMTEQSNDDDGAIPVKGKVIESDFGSITYKENVHFMEEYEGYLGVEVVEKDSVYYYKFSYNDPSVVSLNTGDVIIGKENEPFYMKKVVSASVEDGALFVEVTAAKITDAIQEGEIQVFIPIKQTEPLARFAPPRFTNSVSAFGTVGGSNSWEPIELADYTILEEKDNDGNVIYSLKTNEYSQFLINGGYEITLNVSWKGVYFRSAFYGGYSVYLGLEGMIDYDGTYSKTKNLYPGADKDWETLATWSVCGVPINLDFKLEGIVEAEATVEANLFAQYSSSRTYGFYFSMNNGSWNSGTIFNASDPTLPGPTWDLEGDARAEVGLKPKLALGLGGKMLGAKVSAHAGFYAYPNIKMDASVTGTSESVRTGDWNLDFCFDLGVNAEAAFDAYFVDKSKDWEASIFDKCFDIADGDLCLPYCGEKECGDDGCGGICGDYFGSCQTGYECSEVQLCECVPDCEGKLCGSDGCGGECPNGCLAYGEKYECLETYSGEVCACVPDCDGKACGDDGCGGECPSTCGEDQRCTESYTCEDIPDDCESDCGDRVCGIDPVCGRQCPLGGQNNGQCSDDMTCSDNGDCCVVVEKFNGTLGESYLSSISQGPANSHNILVDEESTDLGLYPSSPTALELYTSSDGKRIVTKNLPVIPGTVLNLDNFKGRKLSTMMRVKDPEVYNGDSATSAGFGFVNSNGVTLGALFVHNHKTDPRKVYIIGDKDTGAYELGTFEYDRWYKVIIDITEDFSQATITITDIGSVTLNLIDEMYRGFCSDLRPMAVGFQCRVGMLTVGSERTEMTHVASIPSTAYFDNLNFCE